MGLLLAMATENIGNPCKLRVNRRLEFQAGVMVLYEHHIADEMSDMSDFVMTMGQATCALWILQCGFDYPVLFNGIYVTERTVLAFSGQNLLCCLGLGVPIFRIVVAMNTVWAYSVIPIQFGCREVSVLGYTEGTK